MAPASYDDGKGPDDNGGNNDGELVEYMSGEASKEFGLEGPMSVSEFMSESEIFTWNQFVAAGCELYINNSKVTSGSATIRPTDTVKIMIPADLSLYTANEVIAEATWGEFTTLAAFRTAGGKQYVNGQEVTSGSTKIRLIDMESIDFDWPEEENLTPIPTYTVTVTFNSGEGSGPAPSSYSVPSGVSITLPGQGSMTAPDGKTFNGWSTGGRTYEPYEYVTVTGNTAFTAQWKAGGGGGTVGDISGSWTGSINGSSVILTFSSGFYSAIPAGGSGGSADSGTYTMSGNTASLYNTSQGAGFIGTATVTGADTMEFVLPGGYYPGTYQFTRSGSSGGGGQTGNGDDDPAPPPQGGDGDLVEYFNGKLSDMGIPVAISANDLIVYGTDGEYDFAKFRQIGGKLHVNSAEVTSGTRMIQPDDKVRVLAPAGFGGAISGVQANRLRFSFRGAAQRAAVQRLRKPWGYSRER
jgi:hypothetical protein